MYPKHSLSQLHKDTQDALEHSSARKMQSGSQGVGRMRRRSIGKAKEIASTMCNTVIDHFS